MPLLFSQLDVLSLFNAEQQVIRVLVIEDDENDFFFLKDSLKEGYDIDHRPGVNRLDVDNPDVILTDLHVDDSSGIDTFRSLRRQFPDVPIVILSGNSDGELARQAVKEGAQDFVSKNHMQSLERTILYAIERHAQKREIEELSRKNSEFSARVGQEIGRILVSISASVDQLMKSCPENPHAISIEDSTNRAIKLAQSLMAYAGANVRRMEPVSLNQEIRENEYLFRMLCKKNIELGISLCEGPANIMSDGVAIRDLIQALLQNATEAIGRRKGKIQIATDIGQKRVLLIIEDTGPGIDATIQSKIFEPFFSTKCRSGLGLAAVYGTVRSQGGDIQCSSAPGCTRFTISWPIATI